MQFLGNAEKDLPPGVRGWNWGAFIFTWIWGIFNNTYIALLCLFPPAHLIMMWVLLFKGNEWAWRNREWTSVDEFQRVQRRWGFWAIGGFFAIIGFFVAIAGFFISKEVPQIKAMEGNFDPHRKWCNYALSTAECDDRCSRSLGAPLSVRGPIEAARNHQGYMEVSIPVRGNRGEGTVYVRTRPDGNTMHQLDSAEVEMNSGRFVLNSTNAGQSSSAPSNADRSGMKIEAAKHVKASFAEREPASREEAKEFYRESLPQIEQDATVQQVLGDSIATQVVHADIDIEGPVGTAEFDVILRGNDTRGLLDLKGTRSMGRWIFNGAQVDLETASGNKTIRFPSKLQ